MEAEGDEIASVSQAIGGAACASGTPNATMPGETGGTTYLNTGVTYTNDTCAKWYLLRVPDLQQRVDQFDVMYDISIDWSNRRSRTQEECVGAEIAVQIYGESGDVAGPFSVPNIFKNDRCYYGAIEFYGTYGRTAIDYIYTTTIGLGGDKYIQLPHSFRGETIKIAATARTPRGSTQGIHFGYYQAP
jgi:hypothetical protein